MLAAVPPNVTANVGPVNLDWMMTGPQAGQFGIEIEATTKVPVRNLWVRKLNWPQVTTPRHPDAWSSGEQACSKAADRPVAVQKGTGEGGSGVPSSVM